MRRLLAVFFLMATTLSPAAEHYYPSWVSASEIHGTWTCDTEKKAAVITIRIDTTTGMMEIHSDSGLKKNFAETGPYTSRWRKVKGYGEFLFLAVGNYNLQFTPDGKVQFNQHLLCEKR